MCIANTILKKIFRKDPSARPSTSELLREPFIENHIKYMIKRLESSKLDDLDSTVAIRNDRNEIAKAINLKISLKELQLQRKPPLQTVTESPTSTLKATTLVNPQKNIRDDNNYNEYDDDDDVRSGVDQPTYKVNRPKTTSGHPVNSKSNPTGFSEKELTPKERMLMNKLKKADEEAVKVSQMAKENYEERMLRQTFMREATINSSVNFFNY